MSAVPQVSHRDISDHRATVERLESCTKPRVLCSYCADVIAPGQEPVSHGVCAVCEPTFAAPIDRATVEYLFTMSELEWGRHLHADVDVAKAALTTWVRANHRARTALRLLVEDMERRTTDWRDKHDHIARALRNEKARTRTGPPPEPRATRHG